MWHPSLRIFCFNKGCVLMTIAMIVICIINLVGIGRIAINAGMHKQLDIARNNGSVAINYPELPLLQSGHDVYRQEKTWDAKQASGQGAHVVLHEGSLLKGDDELDRRSVSLMMLGMPISIDSKTQFHAKQRDMTFDKFSRNDAPWGNESRLEGRRLSSPWRTPSVNESSAPWPCNPVGFECSCLERWLSRPICLEISHRQKPQLEITSHRIGPPVNITLDCPSVSCLARFSDHHSSSSRVFVRHVGYAMLALTADFPPRAKDAYTKNLLVTFESAARYPQLKQRSFFKSSGIDVHASHTDYGFSEFLQVSFAELPPQFYRKPGLTFHQRRDRISFFVTNCKGPAITRYTILDEMTRSIRLDSFRHGRCRWHNATDVTMARDWPQCLKDHIESKQDRRYAEKECVLANSRLTIVIENSREDYYVSEKIYQALYTGAVPVYLGAPNIKNLLPHPDAAILVDDFPSIAEAMHYVAQVNSDEKLWLKHTAWKRKPFSAGFETMLRREFSLCSVCEHFADDAVGHGLDGHLVPVANLIPACMLARFSAARDGKTLPIASMQSAAGVDAFMFASQLPSSAYDTLQSLFQVSPLSLIEFEPSGLSDKDKACFSPMEPCHVLSCAVAQHGGPLSCVRHLFAAYLTVIHGLRNVVVLSAELDATAVRARWGEMLQSLPQDYEIAQLDAKPCVQNGNAGVDDTSRQTSVAGEGGNLGCSGGYVMSQNGARRMLLGQAKVSRATAYHMLLSEGQCRDR